MQLRIEEARAIMAINKLDTKARNKYGIAAALNTTYHTVHHLTSILLAKGALLEIKSESKKEKFYIPTETGLQEAEAFFHMSGAA